MKHHSIEEQMKEARQVYEDTPIPQELEERVRQGIAQGQARRRQAARRGVWRSLGAVAACFVLVFGALNVSPTVAQAAADIPVLGGLFEVLTIRAYHTEKDGIDYDLDVPGVEGQGDAAQRVNQEIQERVDALTAKGQQDWEDYQEAFFATGGTQEQWGDRKMDLIVDYEIKSQTDTTVSFTVDFFQGWVSAAQQRYCYNLDLAADRDITLADCLGENWVTVCNDAVNQYIKEQNQGENGGYFFPADQGGFTTVDESTGFYIDEEGTVVLVFQEYSIAAGAAGIVEIPVNVD